MQNGIRFGLTLSVASLNFYLTTQSTKGQIQYPYTSEVEQQQNCQYVWQMIPKNNWAAIYSAWTIFV